MKRAPVVLDRLILRLEITPGMEFDAALKLIEEIDRCQLGEKIRQLAQSKIEKNKKLTAVNVKLEPY